MLSAISGLLKFVFFGLIAAGIIYAFTPRDTAKQSSGEAGLTLGEFIKKDVGCDKPFDVITAHSKAVADLCVRSKEAKLSPEDYVALELSVYKAGAHGPLTPYTQWVVDTSPSIRHELQSRE
jgi:hypothetical protein